MTYLIVGASSGLGRALAERFAAGGNEIVLVSRDLRDTDPLAKHLAIKYDVKVSPVALDLGSNPLPLELIDTALAAHAPLKGLLLPAGLNEDEDVIGLSQEKLLSLTRVNYLSQCHLLNHYLPRLEENDGVIAGFGSIATARGRSRNAAYAAAKSALESYFESLAHYAANGPLSCQFYILGYLDTNLAFSQSLLFPLASPERVADVVYKRRFTTGTRFLPRPWFILYRMLQFMPWTIFKRLSF